MNSWYSVEWLRCIDMSLQVYAAGYESPVLYLEKLSLPPWLVRTLDGRVNRRAARPVLEVKEAVWRAPPLD